MPSWRQYLIFCLTNDSRSISEKEIIKSVHVSLQLIGLYVNVTASSVDVYYCYFLCLNHWHKRGSFNVHFSLIYTRLNDEARYIIVSHHAAVQVNRSCCYKLRRGELSYYLFWCILTEYLDYNIIERWLRDELLANVLSGWLYINLKFTVFCWTEA